MPIVPHARCGPIASRPYRPQLFWSLLPACFLLYVVVTTSLSHGAAHSGSPATFQAGRETREVASGRGQIQLGLESEAAGVQAQGQQQAQQQEEQGVLALAEEAPALEVLSPSSEVQQSPSPQQQQQQQEGGSADQQQQQEASPVEHQQQGGSQEEQQKQQADGSQEQQPQPQESGSQEQPQQPQETGSEEQPLGQRERVALPPDIEWLHIPKTGTSFGNTLLLWACESLAPKLWVTSRGVKRVPPRCQAKFRPEPTARGPWFTGDHISLTNRTDAELRSVFTLIRAPKQRVASGYHYYLRKDPSHFNSTAADICAFARDTSLVMPGLGIQTKMVLGVPVHLVERVGHHFPSNEPVTAGQAEEACGRLRRFAFVGMTDFYDASVCLFHAMHGGPLHELELENVREGKYTEVQDAVKEADCGDAADERLFECSMELFLERLEQHPQCMKHITAKEFHSPSVDSMLARWLEGRPAPAA